MPRQPSTPADRAAFVVKTLIAPTWGLAHWRKHRQPTKAGKRRVIVFFNTLYLWIALGSVLGVFLFANDLRLQPADWHLRPFLAPTPWHLAQLGWTWFLWSRCTEVFYAFYRDALAKLSPNEEDKSDLTWPRRLQLALRSYGELILDFALLYTLLPLDFWQEGNRPKHFTELVWYSATTITTSGSGRLIPDHPALQFLSAYEIFCGVILLVVSFTIYTSRGLGGDPKLAPTVAGEEESKTPSQAGEDRNPADR